MIIETSPIHRADWDKITSVVNVSIMTIPQKIEALAVVVVMAENDPYYQLGDCYWCKQYVKKDGHAADCIYIRARQLLDEMGVKYDPGDQY